MNNETIAAIATPYSTGGISVIRISGEEAICIADKVFTAYNGKKLLEKKGYTAAYGKLNGINDDAVAIIYKAPKSYTGEDVIEICCHGGLFITRELLRIILENGARLAEPGEFTKRAFLNGKVSLTQAEAVCDIINSNNEQALNAAKAQHEGALFKRISGVCQKLTDIAAHLSAWVDYPEDDIVDVSQETLLKDLTFSKENLEKLLKTYDVGKIYKDGIDTAIIGKPNVGKSTLMNLLSGHQKSIVTNIAGTTRDIIEETVNIGDIMLRLSDTAGIRDTLNEVEKVGVELAIKKIETTSLVLAVFDSSNEISQEDKNIIKIAKNKPSIAIINKTDLPSKIDIDYIKENFSSIISISAKDENEINRLAECIHQKLKIENINPNEGIIANERQRLCTITALEYIKSAIDDLQMGVTLDAINVTIESAIESLLELTGQKVTEEVVNNVFAHFCVGK